MKKKGLIFGIFLLALGIFLVYWAQAHSPEAGLLEKAENVLSENSFVMSETEYYLCLGGGILIGILGLLRTFKSI